MANVFMSVPAHVLEMLNNVVAFRGNKKQKKINNCEIQIKSIWCKEGDDGAVKGKKGFHREVIELKPSTSRPKLERNHEVALMMDLPEGKKLVVPASLVEKFGDSFEFQVEYSNYLKGVPQTVRLVPMA